MIHVLGGGGEVNRTAIAVDYNGASLLLDYGIGLDSGQLITHPLPPPSRPAAVVLSHGHVDHVGSLPHVRGIKVLATPPTLDIARLMMYDSVKVTKDLGYGYADVDASLASAEAVDYGRPARVGDFTVTLLPNNHIPGASMVLVEVNSIRILYTGDVNLRPSRLTGYNIRPVSADVLIMESTYGDSVHPERGRVERELYESALDVLERGGTVLIPAFSVARSQEVLLMLLERGLGYPIWVDGLARSVTATFLRYPSYITNHTKLARALGEVGIVHNMEERFKVSRENGVIVTPSGMLVGGPSALYARLLASNPKAAIYLVGHQLPETPGYGLATGRVYNGRRVKARVRVFDLSSHADSEELMSVVRMIRGVRTVVLVHGRHEAREALARRISAMGIDVYTPKNGMVLELSNG